MLPPRGTLHIDESVGAIDDVAAISKLMNVTEDYAAELLGITGRPPASPKPRLHGAS